MVNFRASVAVALITSACLVQGAAQAQPRSGLTSRSAPDWGDDISIGLPDNDGLTATGMCWTDEATDTIYRANLDGSDVDVIVPPVDAENPGALAVDPFEGKLYWASFSFFDFTPKIKRSNLDGSDVETFLFLGGKARPGGLAVAPDDGKLYYTDPSDCVPDCGAVLRVDLDGMNNEFLRNGSLPGAIALAESLDFMWWSSDFDGVIYRSDLDGTTADGVSSSAARGIAVNPGGGKLYWTDASENTIKRSNLNGSSPEVVVSAGLVAPDGIALDLAEGKIYWADAGTGKIQRANLNGSSVEDLVTDLVSPSGLALLLTGDDEDEDDDEGDDEGDDLFPESHEAPSGSQGGPNRGLTDR